MNCFRLFFTIFDLCVFVISNLSPNSEKEMGTMKGDSVAKGGQVNKLFLKLTFMIFLYGLMAFLHLLYYGDQVLSYLDLVWLTMLFSGFALRMWSYWTLGHMFTFGIGLREDHKLITSGPYQYLVHPSYTGQIMTTFGTLLFLNVGWISVLCLGLTLFNCKTLAKRFVIEEDMLRKKFGEEYDTYLKARWRFIPFY